MSETQEIIQEELGSVVWNDWAVADRIADQVRAISDHLVTQTRECLQDLEGHEGMEVKLTKNDTQRWWQAHLYAADRTKLGIVFVDVAPKDESVLAIRVTAKLPMTPPFENCTIEDARARAHRLIDEENWPAHFRRDGLQRNDLVRRTIRSTDFSGEELGTMEERQEAMIEAVSNTVVRYLGRELFARWSSEISAQIEPEPEAGPAPEFEAQLRRLDERDAGVEPV